MFKNQQKIITFFLRTNNSYIVKINVEVKKLK